MIALVIGTALTAGIVGLIVGLRINAKQAMRQAMRDVGFSKESLRLYARAIKILRRLDGITDLDGDFAADILSPDTKKQVSEWLADYRKALDVK